MSVPGNHDEYTAALEALVIEMHAILETDHYRRRGVKNRRGTNMAAQHIAAS